MTKLIDIANELNISVSTVSKALNDSGRVSQQLRKKIKQTAERMQYYPNESARTLKTRSSTMIGVIKMCIRDRFCLISTIPTTYRCFRGWRAFLRIPDII